MSSLPTRIIAVIRSSLSATRIRRDFSEIEPGDCLFEDLRLDSLDVITFAMDLEEAFGVELPDSTVTKWRTVGDVIESVAVLVGEETPCG